jgi:transcriptional regulator with XRE-family HTH domain
LSNFICAREDTLHKRLQEERQRLGLTQAEAAEIGGVKRRAQINYESGERCPDGHYFSAIAAAGADVQYILTGIRSSTAPTLSKDEEALLDNYRNIQDTEDKSAVSKLALRSAEAAKQGKEESGRKKRA